MSRAGLYGLPAAAGILFFACAMTLFAPAHAALFGDDVARKQVADQGKRIDELKAQTESAAARLGRIEETLRSQPMLELVNQIEMLKQEIRSLRGQIEVANGNIESAAKRQRDMYVDLDTRLRRLEQPGSPSSSAAPTAPSATDTASPPAAASGASGSASADETRVYEAAQQQRRIGNYQGAIAAFQGFLSQYPKSNLAHRAQYWIGDSYFNLRDYRNAIASQQKLITAYPDSASTPDALLNIASSQAELGDAPAARKTMDTLVARHPNSEAAEKAKRRLATLR